jgi:MoaA/NifB/PqqE/SkfB family radical SAM enzyme
MVLCMSHYCKSPWMSLFVYDDGNVKSCCAGQWSWGNLKEQSLMDIINNPKVKELKQDIINGTPNSYCSYCKGCEDNAGESQRQYFDKFKMSDDKLYNSDVFDLMMVDMRWNNLCNLNCAYCDTMWSTTWQKLKGMPMPDLKTNHYVSVLELVKDSKDNMEAIIMGGGEPLLHTQNVELLQSLHDDIHIDIMTNLSINLSHSAVFNELVKKTNVNWCISFENIGDEFEYVRHGATWERMTKNLATIKALPTHSKMLKPTYNLLSATRLRELYKLSNELDFNIHWQTLIHPDQLCVTAFSKPVRDICLQAIEELFDSPEYTDFKKRVRYSQGDDFFEHMKKELITKHIQDNGVSVDKKFRLWLKDYESKYATDVKSFSTLWPNLDNAILKL